LLPHTEHTFDEELVAQVRATHARLRIWPDGGVSRMRLFGPATADGREASGLGYLNALANAEARAAFLSCAKSTAWAEAMLAARPFASLDALHAQADAAWAKVSDRDYDDAFSAHPRIGERKASASAASLLWSRGEQAKVDDASDAARDELARVNAEYEKKFGRTYIVCATGRTAEEMLEIAKGRLGNDAKAEFAAAAAEQRKITALRLDKLVIGHARQGASK
jgi:allantoicase